MNHYVYFVTVPVPAVVVERRLHASFVTERFMAIFDIDTCYFSIRNSNNITPLLALEELSFITIQVGPLPIPTVFGKYAAIPRERHPLDTDLQYYLH